MNATTPNVDTIIQGDCLEEMKKLPDRSIDAIVTDPPYELAFMGKKWDASGIAYNVDMWGECLRVLKPGGHLLAFGGSRTYHRMACAIEDAGFEIRDSLHWVYSQGFPKSLDISKAIDKASKAEREIIGEIDKLQSYGNGANSVYGDGPDKHHRMLITSPSTPEAKQWSGYGSALKPAHEPVVLARKPLEESTIAANVLKWSTGAINIDACRIAGQEPHHNYGRTSGKGAFCGRSEEPFNTPANGRFPSNLIHDGSPEVMAEFAKAGTTKSGAMKKEVPAYEGESTTGFLRGRSGPSNQHGERCPVLPVLLISGRGHSSLRLLCQSRTIRAQWFNASDHETPCPHAVPLQADNTTRRHHLRSFRRIGYNRDSGHKGGLPLHPNRAARGVLRNCPKARRGGAHEAR